MAKSKPPTIEEMEKEYRRLLQTINKLNNYENDN